jgi:Protein of unknown function (DUF3570)
VAASDWLHRLAVAASGVIAGLLGASPARALTLPENRAEGMFHLYRGGGVTSQGPALLVRKSVTDRLALSASLFVDQVSNASIDVVTNASPYKERRNEYGVAADYLVREALVSVGLARSDEPDYKTKSASVDVQQEVFGGMTNISLGFSRAVDQVGRASDQVFFDNARHWQYRVGVTQILNPRWQASINVEAVSDTGYLGNAYRTARVFGAVVPERHPRTRSSRAIRIGTVGRVGWFGQAGQAEPRDALRADYRYFWDTWDIKAHTAEVGYSRSLGQSFLADGFVRYYKQSKALFYSDNAQADTTYLSRNRQLGTFNNLTVGGKLSYDWKAQPGVYDLKANLGLELLNVNYRDYTDVRTGQPYRLRAAVLQLFLTATY